MKRIRSIARPRAANAPADPLESSAAAASHAALERATALLAQGMGESEQPILQLSAALSRMARTLAGDGTGLFAETAPGCPADAPAPRHTAPDAALLREHLARDIAICIENLQFHDRFMQKLGEARELLAALAETRRGEPWRAPTADHGSIELF